jgi:phosphatidylinositol-3,4,5-trisphosphate 3-phosphatase/dual-specificity protein phosphatase PTEN
MTPCGSQACCCACNCLFHCCRSLVSKKKKRIRKNGFDLDLTYLTDRIIVMGFPAVGIEHMYRNPRAELKRFLDKNHGENYKVFNFCCEAGRGYPSSAFDGRAERYPFLDHGCPYLQTMTNFCDSAARWLHGDPDHVVALHCKAGKGRAGLMACCLLLRMGHCATAAEAIAFYGQGRTRDGKGLTVPTQLTSVGYYERCWRMQESGVALPAPPRYTLVEVELEKPPAKPMSVCFQLSLGAGATLERKYESAADTSKFFCNVPVQDVVQMQFFRVKDGKKKKKKLCICNFNTLFLDLPEDGSNVMRIPKSRLDKLCKDKKHKKVPENFQLVLHFKLGDVAMPGVRESGVLAQTQLAPPATSQMEI